MKNNWKEHLKESLYGRLIIFGTLSLWFFFFDYVEVKEALTHKFY